MAHISPPKLCEHLQPLADHLLAAGHKITYAGQTWTKNCRMWLYFDCELDIEALKKRIPLAPCVEVHTNDDTKSGTERGLVCNQHHDGVIGLYQPQRSRMP